MMDDEDEDHEYLTTVAAAKTGSLSGMIMHNRYVPPDGIGNIVQKSNIIRAIDDFAVWVSKARQRGSLVVLAHVLYSYSQFNKSLPVLVTRTGSAATQLEQCFNPNQ